ncbi:hypothetical protein ACLBWT_11745 [Paenibacillus sp. D51F]
MYRQFLSSEEIGALASAVNGMKSALDDGMLAVLLDTKQVAKKREARGFPFFFWECAQILADGYIGTIPCRFARRSVR